MQLADTHRHLCKPHNAGLQDSRESLQLHLEGSIIVVDEAHNLVDAVNAAHTAQLSLSQLDAAVAQLSNYFERFRTRLAAGMPLTVAVACAT